MTTKQGNEDLKTIKLKNPITWGNEIISVLEFKEPKGKQMRSFPLNFGSSMETGVMLDLAAKLCCQPDPVMDELSWPDIMQILEVLGDFLGDGQKTGNQS